MPKNLGSWIRETLCQHWTVPILSAGNILDQLETRNGFPVLDEHFQTSIPSLFITSMPATQDFGPFFAFTISVRVSAWLICEAIEATKGTKADSPRNAQ